MAIIRNSIKLISCLLLTAPLFVQACSPSAATTAASTDLSNAPVSIERADYKAKYSRCTAVAGGKAAKGSLETIYFDDATTKQVSIEVKLKPDAACASEFTLAKIEALYSEKHSGAKPSEDQLNEYMDSVLNGETLGGNYEESSASAGTISMATDDIDKNSYRSYKISGKTLSLSANCVQGEGEEKCIKSGPDKDEYLPAAADFSKAVTYTRGPDAEK